MARPAPKRPRSPLTPLYAILGVVALVGLAVIAFQMFDAGEAATAPVPVNIDPAELARTPGIAMGAADAPVVIYEFADFQCPACGQWATWMGPLIKERLVEPGLARYVFYDFPLAQHRHAFLAARAGRCAHEQGRFWEYHDVVFARQPTWSAMSNATELFVEMAEDVGLNREQFEACLRSTKYQEEVSRSMELGRSLGVPGTPTLFINGKRLQQLPGNFEALERIVREEAGVTDGAAR